MPSSFEFRVPEKLPMPSLATRASAEADLGLKADKSTTITGGGLATGGGSLAADRVITVTKATGAEAAAGTNDTHAVTPLALANPLNSIDIRLDALEVSVGAATDNVTPDAAPVGYVGGIADEYGNYSVAFRPDGTTAFHTMEALSATMSAYGTPNSENSDVHTLGYSWAIADGEGRVSVAVRDDGSLIAIALDSVESINGIGISSYLGGGDGADVPVGSFTADINHIVAYGQSRSIGYDSTPAISTTQTYDSLMFVGGVRPLDGGSVVATIYGSVVALEEHDSTVDTHLGETPMAGMMECIKERIAAENLINFGDHSYRMLASSHGVNGTTIAQLSSGGNPYNAVKTSIDYGYLRAQGIGKSYKWRGFTWSQGEADYTANTPGATYETKLLALRSEFDAYAKTVTGQTEDAICFIDQLDDHASYGHPGDPYIALVQLKVAKANPLFVISTPTYHITVTGAHHSNSESKWLGAYHGIAYHRTIIGGVKWEPCRPIAVYRQGVIITARFNVPMGNLTIDNIGVAAQANAGFTLVTSADVNIPITSVTVTGRDMVRIIAASAPAAGAKLRYGFPGKGNLRDSQGDTITFLGDGLNKPMHNWCVMFEEILV